MTNQPQGSCRDVLSHKQMNSSYWTIARSSKCEKYANQNSHKLLFLWGWNVVNFIHSVASCSFYLGSKPWFLCKVVNLYWNALHSLKCTLWKKSSLFNILTQYICHANLISISSIIISAHACDTNWIVKEIAELFTAKETANVYLKINFLQLKKIGNSASHCKSFCQLL